MKKENGAYKLSLGNTSLNKEIASEIKNFWDFNSDEIEVFPRKVNSKSKDGA